MAVDKLVDSTQLDSDLTSVANAIRVKGGANVNLAFPSDFVGAITNIPNTYTAGDEGKVVSNGALISQTAHATVTQNGTIDTTLNNSVTVNVSSGLALLGSGEYTKSYDSASIEIPVSYSGTPKEYYYYNTTPKESTQQTVFGYRRILDNADLATQLPSGVCAHRLVNGSGAYTWSASAQAISLTDTKMSCSRPGPNNTHYAGTYKWYIYGEATT